MSGSEAPNPVGRKLANPYVGPRPLETGERLFGRERELTELYYLLGAERVVLLYSPSGAGKSSLVQAGLIPRLRKRFDVWRPTRVGRLPAAEDSAATNRYVLSAVLGFEEGIPERSRRSAVELSTLHLADYVATRPRRPSAPENIVLFFDQFEEILTTDSLAIKQKRDFFKQLGELLQNPAVWALFGLREEFIAQLDPYVELVPTHLRNRYRIDLLSLDAAKHAIIGPTSDSQRFWTDPAADKLVRDLSTVKVQLPDGTFEPTIGLYVEPMHLQVVCRSLWERMPADDLTIDPVDVEQFGSVTSALSDYFSEAVTRIAAGDEQTERAVREWIDQTLISAEGIRTPVLHTAEKIDGLHNSLISRLVDSHLIRADKRGGATWYELAHDRLIEPVRHDNKVWFDNKLSLLQKQAKLWSDESKPDSLLLRGKALREAEAWESTHKKLLTTTETTFLRKCLAARSERQRQERANRRVRVLLSILVIVGIVAALLGTEAYYSNLTTRSLALAAQSAQALGAGNEELATIAAMQALEFAYTPAAERALAEATGNGFRQIATSAPDDKAPAGGAKSRRDMAAHGAAEVTSTSFSMDAKLAITARANGMVQIFDAKSGNSRQTLSHGGGRPITAAIDSTGKRVLTSGGGRPAILWDADAGNQISALTNSADVASPAFSLNGQQVCDTSQRDPKLCWDSSSGKQLSGSEIATLRSKHDLLALAYLGPYSADGRRAIVKKAEREYSLIDAFSGEQLTSLKGGKDFRFLEPPSLSPDGQHYLYYRSDNQVTIEGATGGFGNIELMGFNDYEKGERAAFSLDSRRVIFTSLARISVWNISSAREILVLPAAKMDGVTAAAITRDRIQVGFQSGRVELWQMWPDLDELLGIAKRKCGDCRPKTDSDRQLLLTSHSLLARVLRHSEFLGTLWTLIGNLLVGWIILRKGLQAPSAPPPARALKFSSDSLIAASVYVWGVGALLFLGQGILLLLSQSVLEIYDARLLNRGITLFMCDSAVPLFWPGFFYAHFSRFQSGPKARLQRIGVGGIAGAIWPLIAFMVIFSFSLDLLETVLISLGIDMVLFVLNALGALLYIKLLDVLLPWVERYRAQREDDD